MTSSKISVSDINIIDMSPRVPPELDKYAPKTLSSKHMEFKISGVSNAVSNAIRRTIGGELLVSCLETEYENIKTNDLFIIPEMITEILRRIPIDQKTPLDAVFGLDITNKTAQLMRVKSGNMSIVSAGKDTKEHPSLKKLPFNETFTICTLDAGKTLKIENIKIQQLYGYTDNYGALCLAVNTSSIALDQQPINLYIPDDKGIPSRMSNPRSWKISFNTNGTMDPKELIVYACNNIIARVQAVSDLLYAIEKHDEEYVLTIDGETDTIGNLFMRTINDLYPDIRAVVYNIASVDRTCYIRIICDEDINIIYNTTIRYLVKQFTEIREYFE